MAENLGLPSPLANVLVPTAAVSDAQALAQSAKIKGQHETTKDDTGDAIADGVRRAAEKRLAEKQADAKKAQAKESFSRDDGVQRRFNEAMDGKLGPDVQASALGWANNTDLQAKLTEGQKRLFKEAMAQDPARGAQAGQAMARLAATPEFRKAVVGSQTAAVVQDAIVQNPQQEAPAQTLLQSRFMQAGSTDESLKSDFMRFGLQRGNGPGVRVATDMLGSLVATRTPIAGQRAALDMVKRGPDNVAGMKNVDAFVQQPEVKALPTFARGEAVSILARADGSTPVREGLQKLAGDPTLGTQDRNMVGRFFMTVGTGNPSEFRALCDKNLIALQSPEFPQRQRQVGKFLSKVTAQVQKGGADSVDVPTLMRQAKASPLPTPPVLSSEEGLDEESARKVRSQNRAKVMNFYTRYASGLRDIKQDITSAKYFEDINDMPDLRPLPSVDMSMLPPEEQDVLKGLGDPHRKEFDEVSTQYGQRLRELKFSRISPQRRLALQSQRATGKQEKYFTRSTGGAGTSSRGAFPAPGGAQARGPGGAVPRGSENVNPNAGTLPRTALQGGRGGPSSAARAVARSGAVEADPLDGELMSADDIVGATSGSLQQRAQQAKQLMAKQWKDQMEQVMKQLLDEPTDTAEQQGGAMAFEQEVPSPNRGTKRARASDVSSGGKRLAAATPQGRPTARAATTQGKIDGNGIPRTFEPDLGGTQRAVVRPPAANAEPDTDMPDAPEPESRAVGRPVVKPNIRVRAPGELFAQKWKALNPGELAIMKNLGWNQQTWDSKTERGASIPSSMRTRFSKLSGKQKQSVQAMGLSEADWDDYAAQFGG